MESRKNNRLKNYNYNTNGKYFLTFCTVDRKNILSRIVGYGIYDVPKLELSRYGEIIQKNILSINEKNSDIYIEKYVIMPNHVHLLVIVNCEQGTSRAPSPTNARIPMLISTLKRLTNREAGFNLWQRSYHDHIIRDDNDYEKIWQYIENNPQKWELDKYFKL